MKNRPTRHCLPMVAALASIAVLAACGSSEGGQGISSDSSLKISFANATEASDLFNSVHTGLDGQIKSKQLDVAIKWYDNNLDPATMLKNASLMVQDKPDAIINYPVTNVTKSLGTVFSDAKIPCVSLNNDTPGCTFMNIDNVPIGQQAAKVVTDEAEKRGWNSTNTTVLIGDFAAAGESVNAGAWEFYKTLAPVMGYADPGELTVKSTKLDDNAFQFDTAGSTDGSFSAVKNLIPKIPKDNHVIVFTVADDASLGAIRALEDAGLAGDDNLLVGGTGGSTAAVDALKNDPRWVAEGAVFLDYWGIYATAAAQAMVDGTKPTDHVTAMPQAVLTKTDVDEYFPDGAKTAAALPPLVDSNQWLADSGILQQLGIVKDLS